MVDDALKLIGNKIAKLIPDGPAQREILLAVGNAWGELGAGREQVRKEYGQHNSSSRAAHYAEGTAADIIKDIARSLRDELLAVRIPENDRTAIIEAFSTAAQSALGTTVATGR